MTYTLFEYCRDNMESIIPAEFTCIEEDQGIENILEDKLQTMEVWLIIACLIIILTD